MDRSMHKWSLKFVCCIPSNARVVNSALQMLCIIGRPTVLSANTPTMNAQLAGCATLNSNIPIGPAVLRGQRFRKCSDYQIIFPAT